MGKDGILAALSIGTLMLTVFLASLTMIMGESTVTPPFLTSSTEMDEGKGTYFSVLLMSVATHELKASEGSGFLTYRPSEGAVFLKVYFNVVNKGSVQETSLSRSDVELTYKGKVIDPVLNLGDLPPLGEDIFPGVKKTYSQLYEVPKNVDVEDVVVTIHRGRESFSWRLKK